MRGTTREKIARVKRFVSLRIAAAAEAATANSKIVGDSDVNSRLDDDAPASRR